MKELCSIEDVVERMKDVLCTKITTNAVRDWHVADALGISSVNLATMKSRKIIPFKEIVLFCNKCGLDPRDILLKESC